MSNRDEVDESIENVSTSKSKIIVIIVLLLVLAGVGFGFLYWFQLKPENKEHLESLTGIDLTPVENIAKTVGQQTNNVLEKTPLGEILLQETAKNQIDLEKPKTSTETTTVATQPQVSVNTTAKPTLDENNLQTTDINEQKVTTPLNITNLEENTTIISSNTNTAGNIIQPPANAPVLNLVTEVDPKNQAHIDELQREKALAEIEKAINSTSSSLTNDELSDMGEHRGSLSSESINIVEDKVITQNFVEDIASYAVNNYTIPEEGKGFVSQSPAALNMFYGSSLQALPNAGGEKYAREYILEYAYTPNMINALYKLYGNKFIDDIKAQAESTQSNGKKMSDEQQKEFYSDYSNYLTNVADGLQSIIAVDIVNLADKNVSAKQQVKDAQEAFSALQVEFEQARYDNKETATYEQQMFNAAKDIETANKTLESTQASILTDIKGGKKLALSDENLLYVLEWLARRESENKSQEQIKQASSELVGILYDMASRLNSIQE